MISRQRESGTLLAPATPGSTSRGPMLVGWFGEVRGPPRRVDDLFLARIELLDRLLEEDHRRAAQCGAVESRG
jgi:hypothetical protein